MITCSRETLLYPLSKVVDVARKKSTLPILQCVLIECDGQQLRITASDLEQQLVASVPSELPAFSVCVEGKKLIDALRGLPEGCTLAVGIGASVVTIKNGKNTQYRFTTMPPENFPEFDKTAAVGSFSADAAAWRRALVGVQTNMAEGDVRYQFNGACLEVSGALLSVVATDGHTLGFVEQIPIEGTDIPSDRSVILPRNAALQWAKALPDDGSVSVAVHEHSVCLQVDGLVCWSRLIDGRFPPWRRQVRDDFGHTWTVSTAALIASVNRARSVVGQTKVPAMLIRSGDGVLTISARSPGEDEIEDVVDAVGAVPGVEFGVNIGYVSEAAEALDSDVAIWEVTNDGKQTVMRAESGGTGARRVIMPMRI